MSNYIVTDTELTSIADTIRTKSGQSGSLSFPNEFISGIESIGGGGESSYELIGSTEVTVSTTSTSATSVLSWRAAGIPASAYPLFFLVRIRDKAGPREGYFYGSDNFYFSKVAGSATGVRLLLRLSTDGVWMPYGSNSSTGYGVYINGLNTGTSYSTVRIYSRYNSTYSGTIDGTYSVEWYRLNSPNNVTP